ncbi:SpoIIE family protein phosphatase [Kitasatospora sp. NBC_01539]|uniref:SpoIIE family protein phosphatase n=1 Tax=Kitasatospora sp. NBC_01539 TaxID=2903577 RepID=UPI00386030B1
MHNGSQHTAPPSHGEATLVVDEGARITACSPAAGALLGRAPAELCGRPVQDLLLPPGTPWPPPADDTARTGADAVLRHRDGFAVAVRLRIRPLHGPDGALALVHLAPTAAARHREHERALLAALFGQTRIGLLVLDTDLRLVRANLTPQPDPARPGAGLDSVLLPADAAGIQARVAAVVATGEPFNDWVRPVRLRRDPGDERILSLSAMPMRDPAGRIVGALLSFADVTAQHTAQRRIDVIDEAARGIGRSLDVTRCAEELVAALVPAVADLASVDLTEVVLRGEEPGEFLIDAPLRRAAVASADGTWPEEVHPPGATIRVRARESDYLRSGLPRIADMGELRRAVAGQTDRERLLLPDGASSFLVLPLQARGLVLGALGLWRTADRPAFDADDATLVGEIGSRASLSIDNARRYTREHQLVQNLQESLLPRPLLDVGAAQTAGTYVPAGTSAQISGVWFDAIPLSSARVAFVVGDARSNGLDATATMGRLRTAVRTLADLDLPPEELLTHLDDLALHLRADGLPQPVDGPTCLYAVYDPSDGTCTAASAGHRPPVVATPDGPAAPLALRPGPPLGAGAAPFEPVSVDVPPGTLLALFTDGLLERAGADEDKAVRMLGDALRDAAQPAAPVAGLGREVLTRILTDPPGTDLALLLARVRTLPEGSVLSREFPVDPAAVADARSTAAAQLTAWGLDDLVFTTELIVSELVTNAIRYAGGPIVLRLIRDERLICEVSDPSQTQPRLRRARPTDEGGRGLFLIAQLTSRWGSRYTPDGKVIWTEQEITAAEGPPPA